MDFATPLSASQEKKLEAAVAWISGIAAWEFQSTNKFDKNVPIISKQRLADAISQTFGQNVATTVFPNIGLNSNGMKMNPAGVFNTTMGTGIGLYVVDSLASEFFGTEYRKADGAQPIVRGLAKGLLYGGIVGGFFDDPSGYGLGIPARGAASPYVRGPAFDQPSRVNQLNR